MKFRVIPKKILTLAISVTSFAAIAQGPTSQPVKPNSPPPPIGIEKYVGGGWMGWCEKALSVAHGDTGRCETPFTLPAPVMLRSITLVPHVAGFTPSGAPSHHDAICATSFFVAVNQTDYVLLHFFSWNQDEHGSITYTLPVPLKVPAGTHNGGVDIEAFTPNVSDASGDTGCAVQVYAETTPL